MDACVCTIALTGCPTSSGTCGRKSYTSRAPGVNPTVANHTDGGVNWSPCQSRERLIRKREYPAVVQDCPPTVRRTEKETIVANRFSSTPTAHAVIGSRHQKLGQIKTVTASHGQTGHGYSRTVGVEDRRTLVGLKHRLLDHLPDGRRLHLNPCGVEDCAVCCMETQ